MKFSVNHAIFVKNQSIPLMRPYILSETNFKTAGSSGYQLAVLPWGATEAHNYHLPYGTDVIETRAIATEAARISWEAGARPVVLPVVPFGVNTGQKEIMLDLNMNPGTQLAVLLDIVEVLHHQKIYKLLILNGHGGNNFKALVREAGQKFDDMYITLCNWYQVLQLSDYFENPGDHAGEMETSLMQHLAPDLVLPLNEAGEGKERMHKLEAFREGWAWAERKWHLVTRDTGLGDPKAASAEKGREFFQDLTVKIASLMTGLSELDPKDPYLE